MVYFLFFTLLHLVSKKVLQTFNFPMQIVSAISVCWGNVDFHVVPTQDALRGSLACQRHFQLFFP